MDDRKFKKNIIQLMTICLLAGIFSLAGCSAKSETEPARKVLEETEIVQSEDTQSELEEEKTQESATEEILPPSVTIIMVGDVLLHTRVEEVQKPRLAHMILPQFLQM